ncbi:surface-adhesin E family protein [Parasutterella sp.]|uniref:surface-adhesin E family protein n=1 Tax=Parasutterella sp. TaxID=2049037 RepID=UPI00399563D5
MNPAIRGFNARQNATPAGSNVPMPIFIPPIIAGHNTIQVTNDMYLIKTGMRKQGDKLQFWTLQNHSYTPDSKSAKVQFSVDCLARIYSPIALVTYPELDGKGKQIKSTTFDPKFRPIREKSAMDRLHELLCPKPKN